MEETISDGGVPGTAAVFKKPSGKRRGSNYRRQRLSREDEEEEEEEDDDRALSSVNEPKSNIEQEWMPIHKGKAKHLQDLLEGQRGRAKGRRKGVDSSTLIKGPSREAEEQQVYSTACLLSHSSATGLKITPYAALLFPIDRSIAHIK